MNRIVTGGVVAAVAVAGGLWLWSGSSPREGTQRLVLTGSSTVAPLASEIGKRFESLHPGVRVDVQTGGSSRGIADARRGTADIGMASRALKDTENDLLAHQIARDGVCIILHAENPVTSLTDPQVIDIYTNKIDNWQLVGGNDAPILVVNKAEGRATLEVFLAYFKLENPSIQADVVIGDNEQGIKTVAGNANAIGYVSVGTAEYDSKHAVPIKLLPTGGIPASTRTLADGSFPISRPLNLVTRGAPTGLAKTFIEYCQSEQVHDLIKAQYFVPVER